MSTDIERDDGPAVYRSRWVLVIGALVWFLDFLYRHYVTGIASNTQGRALLYHVGVICAVCGLVMLVWTRSWTLMKYALMVVLLCIGGLLVRVIAGKGPQPVDEFERDILQSGLEVGAAGLIVSTVSWVVIKEWRRFRSWRARRGH